jgi:sporulation protein YlmC with PRC-barrel domain
MSSEFRLKKLRGSGGFVMAMVTDEQQMKGNLGGPDLFLAPMGRLESERISKYYCNTCEKEYEGSPKIDYETPNEVVAENLILLEKGQYICTTCGSVLAEYRNFSKQDESAAVGMAKPDLSAQSMFIPPRGPEIQETYQTTGSTSAVKSFNSITGITVYDSEARKVGVVKEIGIQPGQSSIILIVTKNDGSDVTIKWDEIRKIGEVVLLGGQMADSNLKCAKCGNINSQGSKFCETCGNKLM